MRMLNDYIALTLHDNKSQSNGGILLLEDNRRVISGTVVSVPFAAAEIVEEGQTVLFDKKYLIDPLMTEDGDKKLYFINREHIYGVQ